MFTETTQVSKVTNVVNERYEIDYKAEKTPEQPFSTIIATVFKTESSTVEGVTTKTRNRIGSASYTAVDRSQYVQIGHVDQVVHVDRLAILTDIENTFNSILTQPA